VGTTRILVVFRGSPAEAAGLAASDIVLGPPGKFFDSRKQLREWTLVSPRGVPLPLEIPTGGAYTKLELALTLKP
jgi:hypothetical protein